MDKPLIIPFRVNKNAGALNSPVNDDDYFVTEPMEGYMCTVEYIMLESTQISGDLKISVYDFNADPKGTRVLVYNTKIEWNGTHFFTKIRMAPGEKLKIKAMGARNAATVHVSGYYELIPQV